VQLLSKHIRPSRVEHTLVSGFRMGGPCRMQGKPEQTADGRTVSKLTSAPACTDNFQVLPFLFAGAEWHSCEQAYQAHKFVSTTSRGRIQKIVPKNGETDSAHGMRAWSQGQSLCDVRPDWNAVKVEVMLRVNRAKYAQHEQLQEQLLSTGASPIVGGPSTSWRLRDGSEVNWSHWNGLIQMRIRAELRASRAGSSDDQSDNELLRLVEAFESYCVGEGGPLMEIPGSIDFDCAQAPTAGRHRVAAPPA